MSSKLHDFLVSAVPKDSIPTFTWDLWGDKAADGTFQQQESFLHMYNVSKKGFDTSVAVQKSFLTDLETYEPAGVLCVNDVDSSKLKGIEVKFQHLPVDPDSDVRMYEMMKKKECFDVKSKQVQKLPEAFRRFFLPDIKLETPRIYTGLKYTKKKSAFVGTKTYDDDFTKINAGNTVLVEAPARNADFYMKLNTKNLEFMINEFVTYFSNLSEIYKVKLPYDLIASEMESVCKQIVGIAKPLLQFVNYFSRAGSNVTALLTLDDIRAFWQTTDNTMTILVLFLEILRQLDKKGKLDKSSFKDAAEIGIAKHPMFLARDIQQYHMFSDPAAGMVFHADYSHANVYWKDTAEPTLKTTKDAYHKGDGYWSIVPANTYMKQNTADGKQTNAYDDTKMFEYQVRKSLTQLKLLNSVHKNVMMAGPIQSWLNKYGYVTEFFSATTLWLIRLSGILPSLKIPDRYPYDPSNDTDKPLEERINSLLRSTNKTVINVPTPTPSVSTSVTAPLKTKSQYATAEAKSNAQDMADAREYERWYRQQTTGS